MIVIALILLIFLTLVALAILGAAAAWAWHWVQMFDMGDDLPDEFVWYLGTTPVWEATND